MREQELNEKLARWAGVPDNIIFAGNCPECGQPMEFTQSLDACFKWLVPKVSKTNEVRIIIPPNTEKRYLVEIGHQDRVEAETLALALCLAIKKLIDKGG